MTDQKNSRLLSLDAFRGFTVAGMLLVNNPGDWGAIYRPFAHADWNGCTFADLIFPFFLFISGVSITFALSSGKEDPQKHAALIKKIIKRAVILFALGIVLAFIPLVLSDPAEAFRTFRIPGILQRIAVVYLISSLIFLKTNWKTQSVLFVLILIVYWAIMTKVSVPGFGAANLEKETNIGAWLDRTILTENHLWKLSKTWDPEGILGTLPSIATAISGLLTALWLRLKTIREMRKITSMIIAGIILAITGYLWGLSFPINKSLWTSSYVLFTSGLALIVFASFYFIIDLKGYNKWSTPLLAYGTNAITAFFTSMLAAKLLNAVPMSNPDGSNTNLKGWLYDNFFSPYFSPYNASLAFALAFVLLWLTFLWWMYSRKIIIKI